MYEIFFVLVLMYGSEALILEEKERSRIRAVQMDNLRGLLGIRRMGKVPSGRITELCRVTKEVEERINEGVLQWFDHVKEMENDRIGKRFYVGKCAGGQSVR